MNEVRLSVDVRLEVRDSRNGPIPLRVTLDARRLGALAQVASRVHRLYELMLIQRPGELLEYVEVVPLDPPPVLASRLGARAGRVLRSLTVPIGNRKWEP